MDLKLYDFLSHGTVLTIHLITLKSMNAGLFQHHTNVYILLISLSTMFLESPISIQTRKPVVFAMYGTLVAMIYC